MDGPMRKFPVDPDRRLNGFDRSGYNRQLHNQDRRRVFLSSPFSGRVCRAVRIVLLLVFTTGLAACSRSEPPAAPIDARALFGQACAKCHAEDGSGGLPTVPNGPRPVDLTAADWQRSRSDADVAAAIKTGRGAMPPFADVLTADQISALASYVRTLKHP
jgi:mono/diheme cytochrome c family protein